MTREQRIEDIKAEMSRLRNELAALKHDTLDYEKLIYPAVIGKEKRIEERYTGLTGAWDMFYIHLPFDPKRRRSVVLLRLSFLLGRRGFGRKSKSFVYSVK